MRYTRTQIYLDPDDHRRLVDSARARGISLAELIREIVSRFTREETPGKAQSFDAIIGVADGEPTDIARRKDEYMNEVWDDRLAKKMGREETSSSR